MPGCGGGDSVEVNRSTRRRFLATVGALGVTGIAGCGGDSGDTATETGTDTGTPTPDPTPTRTQPDVDPITSVTPNAVGDPPEEATVLFGGDVATLEKFESRSDGGEAPWTVAADGSHFTIDVGTGDLLTRDAIGDCHLHLEFAPPDEPDATGQNKGNSGVKMMKRYEFQILNNRNNDSPGHSLAGGIYGQSAPLVDPHRPPTEWQTYDIVWRGPAFENGEVVTPGRGTAFLNGVLVQAHRNFKGITSTPHDPYEPHPEEQPLLLQDHNDSAVRFGNVWYQPLPEEGSVATNTDTAYQPDYDDDFQESSYHPDPENPARTVTPGAAFGDPPSDATILLSEDGSLDGWESADGGDPGWTDAAGYVAVAPGTGNIRSETTFGDCQLHAEFRIPEGVGGVGRNRGNSGLLLADRYEIQILDNHDNVSEHDRWVGAYTGQAPPLRSPVRSPGEWQAFDVVWEGPRFSDGQFVRPARLTALLNGVVVQNRLYLNGPNASGSVRSYEAHPPEAPLGLQDGGDPVHFRNVWFREI